ncbi:hypothetical protein J7384_08255 [Endozoicomonas sp. G2_1]|uniref:hypothetical protein n=1 Tax=Endozoicomonas sp. G2_1 TaxID=2821091 RepID=UPI001ADA68BB|nr:hypothetical protein [Endozoicomonas sp. G2_1]MBO9490350.1 hypothetical protein [Endozoicomonas sp. G2_1]
MFNLRKLAISQRSKSALAVVGTSAVAIFCSNLANAGAWVAGKGEGYNKFAYAYYEADEFRGENDNFSEFIGENTSFYGEYGLGNNFAIYGQLLYQSLEQTDANGLVQTNNGLGDAEIGIRYQWQAEPFVLSTSFLAKLPYLYDEDEPLALGNGQEDYELRVLLGKSLNQYGYVGAEFGYRLRTDAPSDEYRYLLEYGFNVNKNLYLRTKLDGVLSAENADDVDNTNANLSVVPEFDSGKWELTAGWTFDSSSKNKWGLELTYTKDIYGKNTLDGDSIQLGLTRVF